MEVEYQMAFTLPAPVPCVIGVACNRRRQDFSARDRLCLNLLRPHILQAAENLAVLAKAQQEVQQVQQELEAMERGVIVLTERGRIQDIRAHACTGWRNILARPPGMPPVCLRPCSAGSCSRPWRHQATTSHPGARRW